MQNSHDTDAPRPTPIPIDCKAYEFVNPESGEKVKLDYTYQYNENPATNTEEIMDYSLKELYNNFTDSY